MGPPCGLQGSSSPYVWLKLLQHCTDTSNPAEGYDSHTQPASEETTALHTLALQLLAEHKATAAQQLAEHIAAQRSIWLDTEKQQRNRYLSSKRLSRSNSST